MRVLILGGTLFIGRRIALELLARGDDVMVVHRGQTEPAELSGCAHVHVSRTALADAADQLRAWRPDAVIDTRAMTAAASAASSRRTRILPCKPSPSETVTPVSVDSP
jgi:nucleoside-diphosphate-sugar epimerase